MNPCSLFPSISIWRRETEQASHHTGSSYYYCHCIDWGSGGQAAGSRSRSRLVASGGDRAQPDCTPNPESFQCTRHLLEGSGAIRIYALDVWAIPLLISWIFQRAELSGQMKVGKEERKAEMEVIRAYNSLRHQNSTPWHVWTSPSQWGVSSSSTQFQGFHGHDCGGAEGGGVTSAF